VSEFLVEAYASCGAARATGPLVEDLALAAQQISDEGEDVRLLRAILVPEDEVCLYLYRSPSAEAVRAAAARAGLRFERITAAASSAGAHHLGVRERQMSQIEPGARYMVVGESKQ
jgi:NAD(P)-dependent dehydrogenase (short-subunit alcohol dehydrogenase family)